MKYSIIPDDIYDQIISTTEDESVKEKLKKTVDSSNSARDVRGNEEEEFVILNLGKQHFPKDKPHCLVFASSKGSKLSKLVASAYVYSEDQVVRRVYGYLQTTWDFYDKILGLRSYNDAMAPMVLSLYSDDEHEGNIEAFWENNHITIGEPDFSTTCLNSFTKDLDVIVHEITHGYLNSLRIEYGNSQTGSISESYCDIVAICAKHWRYTELRDNWRIGENLFRGDNNALRSLKAPDQEFQLCNNINISQPLSYSGDMIVRTETHKYSGVVSHVFYKFCKSIVANSWELPLELWIKGLNHLVDIGNLTFTFSDLKNALIQESAYYGNDIEQKMKNAWDGAII